MELILNLIGEFVIAPIISLVSLVFQFAFWMCCWVVIGMWRGVGAVLGVSRK